MIPTLLCWWMYRESSSTWPHPRHQPLKTVPRDLVLVSRLWYLRCWTDLLITQNSLIKTFRFNSDPNLRILNTENIIRNVCNVSPYYSSSRYPFLGSIAVILPLTTAIYTRAILSYSATFPNHASWILRFLRSWLVPLEPPKSPKRGPF